MQAGDYGERKSEPWTYRARVVPLRTYCGRVVHRRHKHFFRAQDAARIMSKLEPAPTDEGDIWARRTIQVLRHATLAMLERILLFLPDELIKDLYQWGIDILDTVFRKIGPEIPGEYTDRRRAGISAINHIAQESGVQVTIWK